MSANKGLRLIAIFEAVKGCFGLLLAVGAMILSQRDLQQLAQEIVDALRLDPAAHYTSRFIQEASVITARDLGWVALALLAYSLFRFAEAYGLWRERTWAEWLAVVSGSLYIPVEIASLIHHATIFRFTVLATNVLVVLYVAWTLARPKKKILPARVTPAP